MPNEFMYWNELRGLPVNIAGQGRQAGLVEDFYYEPGTQSIHALRVSTGLHNHAILASSSIASIDSNAVIVANENMLVDETNAIPISQLPPGSGLIGLRVVTEKEHELGQLRGLVLGIDPPVALRISAIELGERGSLRISAHEIVHMDEEAVTVIEQAGRRVR